MSDDKIYLVQPTEAEKVTASAYIEEASKYYGADVLKSRMPNPIDGLQDVHRRIIWTAKNHQTATSSGKMLGELFTLHEHSPESNYAAMGKMAQLWEMYPLFINIPAKRGDYSGGHLASSRYTDAMISEFAYEIFFKGINNAALELVPSENLIDKEPRYLVPALPTAFLRYNHTIGYSISSKLLPLHLNNVCDLVAEYAEHYMKEGTGRYFPFHEHAEKFIPEFPITNYITNAKELVEKYKNKDYLAPVHVCGSIDIVGKTIIVHTVPKEIPFASVKTTIQKAAGIKNSFIDKYLDDVKSLNSKEIVGKVEISFRRNTDMSQAYAEVSKLINLHIKTRPQHNYHHRGVTMRRTPEEVMHMWFEHRRVAILYSLKTQLDGRLRKKRELETYLFVCDKADAVIKTIRKKYKHKGEVEVALCTKFKLTQFQANILLQAPIRILSNLSRPDLLAEIEEVDNKITEITNNMQNIPKIIKETAEHLKKKYGRDRMTTYPDYIGYVILDGGIVTQISSMSEAKHILMKNDNAKVHFYGRGTMLAVLDPTSSSKSVVLKETIADKYIGCKGIVKCAQNTYTIAIKDGNACVVKGIHYAPGYKLFYTGPQATVVRRNGKIEDIDVRKAISVRKSISKGAKSDIVYALSTHEKDGYLFTMNPSKKNTVAIYRLAPDTKKIPFFKGTTHFAHNTANQFYFNVDKESLVRNKTCVVFFRDLKGLCEGNGPWFFDLNSVKTKRNKLLNLL